LDFSLDHAGPLTRTVRDAALVLQAIAGPDRHDDTASRRQVPNYLPASAGSLSGRCLGISESFFDERTSPEVAAGFDGAVKAAEKLGAKLAKIRLPDPQALNVIGRLILLVEAAACLGPYLHRRDDFGADVLMLLDQGRLISGTDYVNAQRLRRLYQKQWAEAMEGVDALLTPTAPIEAPEIGQNTVAGEDVRALSTQFARPFNVLGWPAISVPVATNDLPVGLQVVGKAFDESSVIEIADGLANCQ
jgi:aspartyl-tRNA(Asn)/glutamyl-tRNA(Gln) amidotransferase subunit A